MFSNNLFKHIFTTAIILGGALFGLTMESSAVHASTADTAKWYTHAFVDNGQLVVEWTVEIGYTTGYPQQWIMTNSSKTKLKCFSSGNPQINSTSIYFDGASFIKCAVPSFANEVKRLSNGSINLEPVLETQNILTELDAKVGLSRGPNANPVFTLENNLELFIPLKKGKASMLLTYPNGSTYSGVFPAFGRNQFNIEENCLLTTCQFDHSMGSSHITSDPAPFTINMPTAESTLVIGYSPIYRTYFSGEIFDLFIDPFTRGPGSG